MENKNQELEKIADESVNQSGEFGVGVERGRGAKKNYILPASIVISTTIIAAAWVYTGRLKVQSVPQRISDVIISGGAQELQLEERVLPSGGAVLPVRWGDLGVKMVDGGIIDKEKLESLYAGRGGLREEERRLIEVLNIEEAQNGPFVITERNAGFLLNLFWALGLGTKNDILESGPMRDPRYGGADKFASTGGWTLAKGGAMDHYSRHLFIVLTPEQQALVERVAKNIYRPCCNNATYFPDCNHGMAMLGLLELMASRGVAEDEMYRIALRVNSFWFPDIYLTIAKYLESKGISWDGVNPREVLAFEISSASGYRHVLSQVAQPVEGSGGGCGV